MSAFKYCNICERPVLIRDNKCTFCKTEIIAGQKSDNQVQNIKASYLKTKLKELYNKEDENDIIRLHRAISWVKCAEERTNNPDLKFIALWIAFNACYADNVENSVKVSHPCRLKVSSVNEVQKIVSVMC